MAGSQESQLAQVKKLGQQAASKANVLERFEKVSTVFENYGARISLARRRAVAACGMGALGLGAGLLLTTFPTSLLLAPLLAIGAGSLGALVTPNTLIEDRDDELKKLEVRLAYAQQTGLSAAKGAIEKRYIELAVADPPQLPEMAARALRRLPPANRP